MTPASWRRTEFSRHSVSLARALLGAVLIRQLPDGRRMAGRIVETEAYRATDAAAHSFRGRTERNAAMFLAGGHAYVYFIYGMHYCVNVVGEAAGVGAAVLIRALEPLDGLDIMRARRGAVPDRQLCRGPANLCKALAIDLALNGHDLLAATSELRLEPGSPIPASRVGRSARIGVGGDAAAKSRRWRFFERGNPCVSGTAALNGATFKQPPAPAPAPASGSTRERAARTS